MNELRIIDNRTDRTPLEMLLKVGHDNRVSSRNVYEFLDMLPNHYARWCRRNILENQFAEENVDFTSFTINGECGGQSTIDYRLSVPFAKKLCMLTRSERGEQARDYFIAVEDKLKQVARNVPQLSTSELILQMAQVNVQLERDLAETRREVGEVREEVHQISGKFNKAIETFTAPNIDHWRADMDAKILDMVNANHLSVLKVRGQLYAELEQVANVCLSSRMKRLKTRMKLQGVVSKDRAAVTKLDIISKDKQLRVIFEGIVRNHQALHGTLN